MQTYTSVMAESVLTGQRIGNRWLIEVIGTRGTFRGVRSSLAVAQAVARKYAALLDAPHSVI